MKDYIEYFTGLQRSYGVCKVDDGYIDEVTGKKKWKHEWAKSPVTDQDYLDHIKGIKSIGIQPCTDDGMARFGAIDVDKYPIDKKFYLDVIQDKNHQLYLSYPKVVDYIYMYSPLGGLKQNR